jgi:hypothetical protein
VTDLNWSFTIGRYLWAQPSPFKALPSCHGNEVSRYGSGSKIILSTDCSARHLNHSPFWHHPAKESVNYLDCSSGSSHLLQCVKLVCTHLYLVTWWFWRFFCDHCRNSVPPFTGVDSWTKVLLSSLHLICHDHWIWGQENKGLFWQPQFHLCSLCPGNCAHASDHVQVMPPRGQNGNGVFSHVKISCLSSHFFWR